MKVEIISKETIKPSSPTPDNRRNFKLSLLDQLIPGIYDSFLYFFSSNHNVSPSKTSQNLKKSFRKALTLFYPLAGKTVDNIMIDCNDDGALYMEARVDIPMSGFLQQPDGQELKQFLPTNPESSEETIGYFTLVQISFFSCGGVAIGICFSHKLIDGCSAGTFMRCWAANMTGDFSNKLIVPVYEAADLFPPTEILTRRQLLPTDYSEEKLRLRRLVFDSSKIANLKPSFGLSRSDLVTAIIWKSALNAARSNSRSSKHSVMSAAVNIRTRISPSLMVNSVGNIISAYTAVKDGSDVDLCGLARELSKGLKVFDEKFVNKLQTEERLEAVIHYLDESALEMMKENVESYICASLCDTRLYDVDFGWGTPVWVTVPLPNTKNLIVLMDSNKGDQSVEAWVVLSEIDMQLFVNDPELLCYACLDPSVQEKVE